MKHFFFSLILSLIAVLLLPSAAFAQTPTQSVSPTTKPEVTEEPENMGVLKDLKDQIASRVAQLKLVQKKGIIGTVEKVSGTQITITDINKQQRLVDVDELTKFSSPTDKTGFGISDLTKGTVVDVLGLYNKQTKHTLARFINVVTLPQFIQGEIASINGSEFSLQVISDKGIMTTVDIENLTKTSLYSKEDGLQKAGFSKIEQGKQIVVIGFPDTKNPKRIIASRILIFPEAAKNPRIIIPQQALDPNDEVTTSTGSGNKLTPIR